MAWQGPDGSLYTLHEYSKENIYIYIFIARDDDNKYYYFHFTKMNNHVVCTLKKQGFTVVKDMGVYFFK